jgi:hypothetical protein
VPASESVSADERSLDPQEWTAVRALGHRMVAVSGTLDVDHRAP